MIALDYDMCFEEGKITYSVHCHRQSSAPDLKKVGRPSHPTRSSWDLIKLHRLKSEPLLQLLGRSHWQVPLPGRCFCHHALDALAAASRAGRCRCRQSLHVPRSLSARKLPPQHPSLLRFCLCQCAIWEGQLGGFVHSSPAYWTRPAFSLCSGPRQCQLAQSQSHTGFITWTRNEILFFRQSAAKTGRWATSRHLRPCSAATVSPPSSAVLYNGRHRVGRRHNVGCRTCAVCTRQASAQPSAATAFATISTTPDGSVASAAASSVQPSAASAAGAHRSRASITAMSTSNRCTRAPRYRLRPLLRPCACAIGCSHATGSVGVAIRARARPADSTVLASSGTSTHTQWRSAVVSQWLGGVGGGAPAHAQRTPAQQTGNRPSPRDDAPAA